jgi:hypothetical protein
MNFTAILAECDANQPTWAGRRASLKTLFGHNSRFALFAVHTRFDAVQWFVTDAEKPDADGTPSVVRQEVSPRLAVKGLL